MTNSGPPPSSRRQRGSHLLRRTVTNSCCTAPLGYRRLIHPVRWLHGQSDFESQVKSSSSGYSAVIVVTGTHFAFFAPSAAVPATLIKMLSAIPPLPTNCARIPSCFMRLVTNAA